AHLVNVLGAKGRLTVDEPVAQGMISPEEIWDERLHSRTREEGGGIAGQGPQAGSLHAPAPSSTPENAV
ncbi:MAG TPA: hypothetical protein VKO35_05100, partial [Acidimicrobiia bacterium]|nr:hypothetical protein [Acidimicrobiia bacterium]